MPVINIQMLEGRTREQKRNLVTEITAVVAKTVGASPENITVVIEEMKTENFATGGVLKCDQ
ncbi:MAG: 2-hydroxymuconate tautomerase [Culicoidibacterales bacterium]